MFTIQGFRANGERIELVNERPAFYALLRDGRLVDYFHSVQATRDAVEAIEQIERAERAEANTIEYRIAA